MINTLRNAWKIPELRNKILFTLMIIVAFRFGSVIPVPFLDAQRLGEIMSPSGGVAGPLEYINMLTGGAFAYATLFALGITPYINASIIMNLLTVAIPALERMAKEGETGRKKIAAITRFATVIIGLVLAVAYFVFLSSSGVTQYSAEDGFSFWFSAVVIVLTFTAGTALIMWMGEQINDKGIGNGISVILFAGIVARLPVTASQVWGYIDLAIQDPANYGGYFIFSPLFVVLFLAVIWVIIFMNDSERRITIQYAKKVVGRKVYGGQSSHLPIKVTMSGVMPIIFASAFLSIPSTIEFFAGEQTGFWGGVFDAFSSTGWLYLLLYFVFIIVFAYFYMTIQYNPIEMANNLKSSNGTIPGIRPGKPTSDFIAKILGKITLIGALFLAGIAIVPIIYGNITATQLLSTGGTSIIIMVGVALETVKQMESQMMMRHYKGFLD